MTRVKGYARKDYHLGRLHLITRGYPESPQYGVLLWGGRGHGWTLDVWVHRRLYTLRTGRTF